VVRFLNGQWLAEGERKWVLHNMILRLWDAGRKVGAKKPLKQRQIWAIRFFLDR